MKKAIVLLHGWLSDINDFDSLMPSLETMYDHIERVTYSGHGNDDPNNFDDNDTFDALDHKFKQLQLEYEIIDVVGFSMGGALAVYLSQNFAFNKLVLLAPANQYLNFKFTFSRIKHFFKMIYLYEKAVIAKDEEGKEVLKNNIRNIFEDDKYSISFAKEKYLHRYFKNSFNTFRKVIKRVNDGTKEIKNPLFIAWGNLDQLVPHTSAKYLYDICTNAERKLVVYEEMSHSLILAKNNQKLIDDILEFLKS